MTSALILLAALHAAGETKIIDGRPMTEMQHYVYANRFASGVLYAMTMAGREFETAEEIDCFMKSTAVVTWQTETFDMSEDQWRAIWRSCESSGGAGA